ncbi:MAG: hypothetical protein MUP22_15025, partial [Desulfobacterales bacterium]|nr:hypothetical protein [Desulfobacterales bacterium]
EHFAISRRNIDPVDDAALWAATEKRPGFLHELPHNFDWRSHNRHWVKVSRFDFAVGLALFRTSPDPLKIDSIRHIHEVFAVLFLTLIYFSLFLFTKTHPQKPPSRRKLQRNNVYKACGYTMGVCIVLILIHYFMPKSTKVLLEPYKPAF